MSNQDDISTHQNPDSLQSQESTSLDALAHAEEVGMPLPSSEHVRREMEGVLTAGSNWSNTIDWHQLAVAVVGALLLTMIRPSRGIPLDTGDSLGTVNAARTVPEQGFTQWPLDTPGDGRVSNQANSITAPGNKIHEELSPAMGMVDSDDHFLDEETSSGGSDHEL
ncbi:hypothetical protein M231_04527 [Tremella mesenterica]|uniref:Uncharacterized protein n=1 Tax=Tremella mesenterica TaxID=5217 RepID=A0A4Q1BKD1_TREME|nr:uncharacterized protein TREMEDRAFT_65756 [Tremella mesenterica DSM 1558]EIW66159.1 hypothetical protein TREMEDRAFT_65756 [Tremella mesenterica DSM 1558]RXK38243.1 hypothetical protein M231_04527 [Tremella mesenterica]